MSENVPKPPVRFGWIIAFVFCALIAACGLYLRTRAQALEQVRVALQSKLEDQRRRKQILEKLIVEARAIQSQQLSEMKELRKLQKRATTRDQFLVTSGDKIVRQLAAYAPSSERRLLFYLPAGQHRLVYAIREALGSSDETYAVLNSWGTDHRSIPNATTVALLGNTVYELRTRVDKNTRESVTIELIGAENRVVHEYSFPLSYPALQGLNNWQNDSEVFASYPNELRSAAEAKSFVDAKKLAPVTPLLTFTLDHLGGKDKDSKGRVKMRFWIDSDSPPCMSDISVAVSYDFLSSNLRYAPQLGKFQTFNETFKRYDGSGCYFFVDEYFGSK
jgi:hypothetical protein